MSCPWKALNIDLLGGKFILKEPEGIFLSHILQVLWPRNRLLVFTINKAKLELGAISFFLENHLS